MKKGKRMGWKGKGFVGGILIAEQLFRSLLDKYPPGFPRVRCVSSKNKFQSFEGNALLSPARSNHALIPSHFLLSVRRSTVLSLSLSCSVHLSLWNRRSARRNWKGHDSEATNGRKQAFMPLISATIIQRNQTFRLFIETLTCPIFPSIELSPRRGMIFNTLSRILSLQIRLIFWKRYIERSDLKSISWNLPSNKWIKGLKVIRSFYPRLFVQKQVGFLCRNFYLPRINPRIN